MYNLMKFCKYWICICKWKWRHSN